MEIRCLLLDSVRLIVCGHIHTLLVFESVMCVVRKGHSGGEASHDKVGGGMAGSEEETEKLRAPRRAYWGAVIGGVITIIGGVFLALFGLLFVGSYIHDPLDILIPLSAAVLSGSAISMIGGFDAIALKNYLRALVGSAMPAAFFLGGYVMTFYAQAHDIWPLLLLLGIMSVSGVLLVAVSRGAFFDGSPNDYGRSEEEWRKRIMKSFWGVLGVVAILIILMMVVAKLVPTSLDGTMCFLVPVLIGLLFFLLYIQWLKLRYGIRRRK